MPFPAFAANDVLAAMITPAVLISASGTLALSTSNRLGRVVDRVRVLTEQAEHLVAPTGAPADELEEMRDLITGQLARLMARIRLLQTSLTTLYMAIGLLVASSLAIGLRSAVLHLPELLPVGFGLCGATAVLVASLLLVRETRLAVHSSMLEMAHLRSVIVRKLGPPDKK